MKRIAIFLLIQAGMVLTLLGAEPATRLAVGTFGLTPAQRDGDLADLIAARLSTTPGFELVERRELDAMLKEAGLGLSGAVRAKDAVRLGGMLRADEFLLGTSFTISGTNHLAVRLVDAKTGVIRAINVFDDTGKSVDSLAGEITRFIQTESKQPLSGRRDYLAIGVIQNLGVNNRFADFPAQMRGTIAAKLGGKVTVLERDVVSFLANEVQLDMAGVTEGAGANVPQMQFGFWIVDGFYQSYEVADPEVELKLRVEHVQNGQQHFTLRSKPDEQFFTTISDTIMQALKQPTTATQPVAPTKQGEIAALETRGRQLIDYRSAPIYYMSTISIRSAANPDKVMSALEEATKVYESILLLDPENNGAKMRLAGCLLFNAEREGGTERGQLEERQARAKDYYRQVIATEDPKYAADARINLALAQGGLYAVDMLRRFELEAGNPKERSQLAFHRRELLEKMEHDLPIGDVMPQARLMVLDSLAEFDPSTNNPAGFDLDNLLFAYRFQVAERAVIINKLLPEMLEKFPGLRPYILYAAAVEQVDTNSPTTIQFLESLKNCEAHPESIRAATNYFTRLSSTFQTEKNRQMFGGSTPDERMFADHQYLTIVAGAAARKRAADKALAPPLTDTGKLYLAKSYMALEQWKEALDTFNETTNATPEEKNECRSHLGVAAVSEALPDSAWRDKTDIEKVEIAYLCIQRKQWTTAIAIWDSMEQRTVRMNRAGAWGYAFAPVLPAVMAEQCRAQARLAPVKNPLRFDLGKTPFVSFSPATPRRYSIQIEGEDLWMAIYSEIKRFHGNGPFAAGAPTEVHEFERSTYGANTGISVSANYIWAGTEDDGLMELDRKTGICRRLTMKDGLFLDGISALKLQGDLLWIAYEKGENGAVGTLDLKTRKLSSFTPNLPANAGANSQPGYYYAQAHAENAQQAPTLPIMCMTSGDPGEMWFGVAQKGVRRYKKAGGIWEPVLLAGVSGCTAMAADSTQGLLVVANREHDILGNEKSSDVGLAIYDYRHNKGDVLDNHQGLPANDVTAVAIDGRIAWVGGRGFVAVVDLQEKKVLRIAYVSASTIRDIQLSPLHAWVAISTGSEDSIVDDSGTAPTGVYRLDRSAIEPVFNH